MQNNLAPQPSRVHLNPFAVSTHFIFAIGNVGWVFGLKSVGLVDVNGVTIAVELPIGGYWNGRPVLIGIIQLVKIGQPLPLISYPVKFPISIETLVIGRGLKVLGRGAKGPKMGTSRQFVAGKYTRVLPVIGLGQTDKNSHTPKEQNHQKPHHPEQSNGPPSKYVGRYCFLSRF